MNHLSDLRSTKNLSEHIEAVAPDTDAPSVSIRVSPNSYLTAFLIGTFISGFMLYLEMERSGFVLFLISWVAIPFLAFSDYIVFDGKRLSRTGILPRIWASLNRSRRRLRITDIEQVDSQFVRALKRGGNVYYRYRTAIRGRDVSIVITSGGEDYRKMINRILPLVPENVLDIRSIELRDYLGDPKEIKMKAAFAKMPEADVLSASFSRSKKPAADQMDLEPDETKVDRAAYLRRLGNELRLIGRLHQALESFRRALLLTPKNPHLLFDFARCLNSFAALERDPNLGRRSIAAMRLAEKRAGDDSTFLARLGETYFQYGEWRRAAIAFQRSLDIAENFLAARGMAEIALREGKLAHVIYQFSAAHRNAVCPALRRYARVEADYFERLNNDDEYMEVEVGRVNLLESLENTKKTVLRIASFGFLPLIFGLIVEDSLFTDIGWAVTAIALMIWTGMVVSIRFLSSRIPYDLIDTDDNDHIN